MMIIIIIIETTSSYDGQWWLYTSSLPTLLKKTIEESNHRNYIVRRVKAKEPVVGVVYGWSCASRENILIEVLHCRIDCTIYIHYKHESPSALPSSSTVKSSNQYKHATRRHRFSGRRTVRSQRLLNARNNTRICNEHGKHNGNIIHF